MSVESDKIRRELGMDMLEEQRRQSELHPRKPAAKKPEKPEPQKVEPVGKIPDGVVICWSKEKVEELAEVLARYAPVINSIPPNSAELENPIDVMAVTRQMCE